MFTGIIEELGRVEQLQAADGASRLSVRSPLVCAEASHGSSVAVNGVCLTVDVLEGEVFTADVMPETLHRSSLGRLHPGDPVNLERPVALGARLGGHLVAGHIDGMAEIIERQPGPSWDVVHFATDAVWRSQLAPKGSVALDGVSLTLVEVEEDGGRCVFSVWLIPTTLRDTVLGRRRVGDVVNLETDLLAKYVEAALAAGRPSVVIP